MYPDQRPHDYDPRAVAFAGDALTLAMAGDWNAAAAAVQACGDRCGPGGVYEMVVAWCDTLAISLGIDGDRMALQFRLGKADGTPEGDVTGSDEVPERVAWAGRVLTARCALDRPMFDALISALPGDRAGVGSHVGAVLEVVAVTLLSHQAGHEVVSGGGA
jgi:hypothetical protein